jgi:hypothetical protein
VGLDQPPGPATIAHEPCGEDGAGVTRRDADGNGDPDTSHVMLEGREVCRAIDTNRDGKPDVWVYFDPNGGVRRQERDTRRSGKIDEVSHFRAGVVEKSEHDSNGDGRVDTWQYNDPNGDPARVLRDLNGNGKVDQWWSWLPHKKGCATVHSDHNEDGKADHTHDHCPAPAASK